jgi:hypothetical protein
MTQNYKVASAVLEKARAEIIREIANAGSAGGIGRAQSYAPILVQLQNAFEIIQQLDKEQSQEEPSEVLKEEPDHKESSDHMARMREARAAKQATK